MKNPSGADVPSEMAALTDRGLAMREAQDRSRLIPVVAAAGRRKSLPFLIGIVIFWGLIYLPGLAWPPMMDDADSEHAVIAREMLQTGDFVTMHVNGIRYLDKAPLPYWIMSGSYAAFGVSEFSARLPLTLFALLTFFAVFALGREIAGEEAGFYSALVLATAIGPYIYTRFVIPDIMVCFWLTVTVHLFLRSMKEAEPSRLVCWSIGIASACDVLTKGLIGMVFPVGIIGVYLLITGNLRHLLRLRLISTTAVFLAVAAPWHVLATLRNPAAGEAKGFFWFYFINEQIYRYLNLRVPHDYDKVPLLLFWGLILVWLFPWTFFVLSSLKQVPLRFSKWRTGLQEEERAALLLAVWAIVILVFFSFSTRQEYYVLPALPAFAVLCGMWLKREADSPAGSALRRSGLRFSSVMLAMGAVGFVIAIFFAATSKTPPPGEDIADLLRKAPAMYKLSMGHLFDLTGQAMGVFRWPLVVAGVAALLGTFFNWLFRKWGFAQRGNLALAGMMVVLFYAVHVSLGIFNPILGSKPLAIAIHKHYQPGDTIVINGQQAWSSSVLFYTGVPLHMLNAQAGDLWYGSLFPDSPKVFEDDASFARLWLGSAQVFFVMPSEQGLEKLQVLGSPYYSVAQSGGKSVYTNHPLNALTGK
ncbi:MAG TPA: glycosyltransferase family 39 protein [Candidatus Dormibacteraeota bacterium]|nr:glycosyltransferase family 39 protein [Candidatus Dormibacteraeota bacterium]